MEISLYIRSKSRMQYVQLQGRLFTKNRGVDVIKRNIIRGCTGPYVKKMSNRWHITLTLFKIPEHAGDMVQPANNHFVDKTG